MNPLPCRPTTLACLLIIGICSVNSNAALIHRYSFNDSAAVKDTAGGLDGKLKGNAKVADGKLTLKNDDLTSGDDGLSYVDFGDSLLPKSNSATIAVWFNAKEAGAFSRIFNIGNQDSGSGVAFMYFVARTADDQSRAAITATDAASKTSQDNDRLDDGKDHMVAVVIDGKAKKMHVFIDGKEPKPAEDLGENTLDKVKPVNNWIGRSSFDSDAGLSGSIDEFRVYDQPLTADEVAAAYKAGPDALPPTTQPTNAP